MKTIQSYDEFLNEGKFGRALAGAALGAGLLLGHPAVGQTNQKAGMEQTQEMRQSKTDITGWGKAKWGMSVDEVKSVFSNIENVSGGKIYDLDYLLTIRDYKLTDKLFDVNFMFDKDNKLSAVQLYYKKTIDKVIPPPPTDIKNKKKSGKEYDDLYYNAPKKEKTKKQEISTEEQERILDIPYAYDDLRINLIQKYGKESTTKNKFEDQRESYWFNESGSVSLYMSTAFNLGTLIIKYAKTEDTGF